METKEDAQLTLDDPSSNHYNRHLGRDGGVCLGESGAGEAAGGRTKRLSRLVLALSKRKKLETKAVAGFDSKKIAAAVQNLRRADQSRLFQLAGWFWKTGTHDMQVVVGLLQDAIARRPPNWFAFYAPDGKPRLVLEARIREQLRAQEKEAWNAADRAFFDSARDV